MPKVEAHAIFKSGLALGKRHTEKQGRKKGASGGPLAEQQKTNAKKHETRVLI